MSLKFVWLLAYGVHVISSSYHEPSALNQFNSFFTTVQLVLKRSVFDYHLSTEYLKKNRKTSLQRHCKKTEIFQVQQPHWSKYSALSPQIYNHGVGDLVKSSLINLAQSTSKLYIPFFCFTDWSSRYIFKPISASKNTIHWKSWSVHICNTSRQLEPIQI